MDRRTIQRYESGERDPRFADLLLLAQAFDIAVEELVREE